MMRARQDCGGARGVLANLYMCLLRRCPNFRSVPVHGARGVLVLSFVMIVKLTLWDNCPWLYEITASDVVPAMFASGGAAGTACISQRRALLSVNPTMGVAAVVGN